MLIPIAIVSRVGQGRLNATGVHFSALATARSQRPVGRTCQDETPTRNKRVLWRRWPGQKKDHCGRISWQPGEALGVALIVERELLLYVPRRLPCSTHVSQIVNRIMIGHRVVIISMYSLYSSYNCQSAPMPAVYHMGITINKPPIYAGLRCLLLVLQSQSFLGLHELSNPNGNISEQIVALTWCRPVGIAPTAIIIHALTG